MNGPIRRPYFVPRDRFDRVAIFGGLGPSFLWGLVPLGQPGIEATGSDAMATGSDVIKPEVTSWETGNQRQTTWFGKKHTFIITDLTTVQRRSCLRHQAGLPGLDLDLHPGW